MNKYIRTKDGVWENEEYWKRPPIEIMSRKEEIIKQSDSIEELCDCYVCIDKCLPNSTPKIYDDLRKLFLIESYEEELGIGRDLCEVYGAIRTNERLIYVAKMNASEKFELLKKG